MAKHTKQMCLSLLLVPVLFLPGCWPGEAAKEKSSTGGGDAVLVDKQADDGSPVLLKIGGRSVITLKNIDEKFNCLLEESPNLKQVLPFMPDAKMNFFKGLVSQEIVNEYIRRHDIDRSPEYQRELENTLEQVKCMLNAKYFTERHPVEVSTSEIRKFYDENKDKIPDLMESQGGVKSEGVSFGNQEDAKAFLAKVKESKDSLEKVATDAGYANDYHDFKLVNAQSVQIDPALKAKIAKLDRFPTTELLNVNDTWWVVKAESKTEPTYVAFDNLKQNLEEYLKKQKQMEVFEKTIETYKQQYDVEIHDEPLRPKAPEQNQAALGQGLREQVMAAQQQDPSMQPNAELAEAPAVEPAVRTV